MMSAPMLSNWKLAILAFCATAALPSCSGGSIGGQSGPTQDQIQANAFSPNPLTIPLNGPAFAQDGVGGQPPFTFTSTGCANIVTFGTGTPPAGPLTLTNHQLFLYALGHGTCTVNGTDSLGRSAYLTVIVP